MKAWVKMEVEMVIENVINVEGVGHGDGDESGNGSGHGDESWKFWVYWGNFHGKKLKMGNDVQRKAKCVL